MSFLKNNVFIIIIVTIVYFGFAHAIVERSIDPVSEPTQYAQEIKKMLNQVKERQDLLSRLEDKPRKDTKIDFKAEKESAQLDYARISALLDRYNNSIEAYIKAQIQGHSTDLIASDIQKTAQYITQLKQEIVAYESRVQEWKKYAQQLGLAYEPEVHELLSGDIKILEKLTDLQSIKKLNKREARESLLDLYLLVGEMLRAAQQRGSVLGVESDARVTRMIKTAGISVDPKIVSAARAALNAFNVEINKNSGEQINELSSEEKKQLFEKELRVLQKQYIQVANATQKLIEKIWDRTKTGGDVPLIDPSSIKDGYGPFLPQSLSGLFLPR